MSRKWKQALRRVVGNDYFPIIVLLAVNLVLGMLVYADYGESWDENLRYQYARRSLAAYVGEGKSLIDEKGAFYVMVARLGGDLIAKITKAPHPIVGWHLVHFLAFLMGVFFLYKICLKYGGKMTALGAALLFNTQPILWGHAFINPKDIPFMAFFLGSVTLGMEMAERRGGREAPVEGAEGRAQTERPRIGEEWRGSKTWKKALGLAAGGVLLAGLIVVFGFGGPVREAIEGTIRQAYAGEASGFLSGWFSRLAQNRGDIAVELYVEKALRLYSRLAWGYVGLALLAGMALFGLIFPKNTGYAWQRWAKPALGQLGWDLLDRRVILAGVFLGLCTSIRVLGPASAGLVGVYFLLLHRQRAISPLLAYLAIGSVVAYLTWPYLWGAPVSNFLHSLTVASDFPWEGKVRFAAIDYPVNAVPRSYLPTLLAIQTPELTLLLFGLGLAISGWQIYAKKADWRKILIAGLWFFLPVLAVIIAQPVMYDNFRQFLFILPAGFIFVAIGLEYLFSKIRRKAWQAVLIAALVLPNIHWLAQLHPYQYIYYNQIVGGPNGAFRRYESDYWATAYREATEFLDSTVPAGATILVLGPSHIVDHYGRADLTVVDYAAKNPLELSGPTYAVIYTRYDKDQTLFPEAQRIFRVSRGGATLAVVKQIK